MQTFSPSTVGLEKTKVDDTGFHWNRGIKYFTILRKVAASGVGYQAIYVDGHVGFHTEISEILWDIVHSVLDIASVFESWSANSLLRRSDTQQYICHEKFTSVTRVITIALSGSFRGTNVLSLSPGLVLMFSCISNSAATSTLGS